VAVDQSNDQRRPFDLKQLIEELVVTLEPMYKNHHSMSLELTPGLAMDTYPGALHQIIANLVSNAMSHAFREREGGHMLIRATPIDHDHVQLAFSDDGVGISPEHLGKVFDPFFTTTLGQGGSGLGMNIVYNLVTGVLGGSISLASTVGRGTQVTMVLPLIAPAIGAAHTVSLETASTM
jgi:signal transduction histidine kinase